MNINPQQYALNIASQVLASPDFKNWCRLFSSLALGWEFSKVAETGSPSSFVEVLKRQAKQTHVASEVETSFRSALRSYIEEWKIFDEEQSKYYHYVLISLATMLPVPLFYHKILDSYVFWSSPHNSERDLFDDPDAWPKTTLASLSASAFLVMTDSNRHLFSQVVVRNLVTPDLFRSICESAATLGYNLSSSALLDSHNIIELPFEDLDTYDSVDSYVEIIKAVSGGKD